MLEVGGWELLSELTTFAQCCSSSVCQLRLRSVAAAGALISSLARCDMRMRRGPDNRGTPGHAWSRPPSVNSVSFSQSYVPVLLLAGAVVERTAPGERCR